MLGRKKTCVLEPVMFRFTQYGKAWVFYDTIEHEARNDSDELRVLLIFDVWNPLLTPGKLELVAKLVSEVADFYRDSA